MNLDLPDFNSFDSTIAALFSRVRGHIEPGAHRMQLLAPRPTLESLNKIPTVLVAGTNGKGTLCALLEHSFRNAGFSTALYTSPHLVSPTERIRIQGRPVSEELFLSSARSVFETAKRRLPDATFFELMTAIAFEIIISSQIDVFVCEVGLGGRLDSTNVLNPIVSVVTSIGLDHTEWLGPTEESIAFEKSFVGRRNKSLVIGKITEQAQSGVQRAMAIIGARPDFAESSQNQQNPAQSLAERVLLKCDRAGGPAVSRSQFLDACKNYFWPGRFDLREKSGIRILLDAAHNSHGVEYFLQRVKSDPRLRNLPHPRILVYASLGDKDWQNVINLLSGEFDTVLFTQTQSARAVHPDTLMQYTQAKLNVPKFSSFATSEKALTEGLNCAQQSGGSLFILGSITLLGEAMEFFSMPVFPESEINDNDVS